MKAKSKASTWRRVHLWLMILWAGLVIPTMLYWRDSVLWIGLVSCYANFVGHLGAWQATRAEGEAEAENGGDDG